MDRTTAKGCTMPSTADVTSKEVVQELYEGIFAGDLERVKKVIHPDFTFNIPPYLAWGGPGRGLEHFMSTILPQVAGATDLSRLKVLTLIAEGEFVFVKLRTGVAGSSDTLIMMENWRVEDGRIVEMELFYFDHRPFLNNPSAMAN
ncbi:nuclear transport factor 2 family protein [Streptomyces mirabilis]|uniref:nuclear transport factor 2 family protein n=1 Tax=Streptomyces mirabilis TaxID=68239 RepID=UPI0036CCC865